MLRVLLTDAELLKCDGGSECNDANALAFPKPIPSSHRNTADNQPTLKQRLKQLSRLTPKE